MKRIFFTLYLLSVLAPKTKAQKINWQRAGTWTLYQAGTRASFRYPVDSLQQLNYITLDEKKMRRFMQGVVPVSSDTDYVWMGVYAASCRVGSQKPRKILISNYGGFFLDDKSGRYYRIKPGLKEEWQNFLNERLKQISDTHHNQ